MALLLAFCVQASAGAGAWQDWMSEGAASQRAGKYTDAISAFRRALSIAEASQGGDRRLLNSIDALASACAAAGQLAESAYQYRRGLQMLDDSGQHDSIEYALLLGSLSSMFPDSVDSNETIRTIRKAIDEQAGSGKQVSSLQTYLFQIYRDHGRYREAESILLEERADFKRRRDVDPTEQAILLNSLGLLRFREKRFTEARAFYGESLKFREAATGSHSPELIEPLNNVAASLVGMGEHGEATVVFERALALCNETVGVHHPSCGITLTNYAVCLRRLGRKKQAARMEADARQVREAANRQNGIGQTIGVGALR